MFYGIREYVEKENIQETEAKAAKKTGRNKKTVSIILFLALVILGAVGGVKYLNESMPNLVGLDIEDAKLKLEERGVKYDIRCSYSEDCDKNIVYEQSIKAYHKFDSDEKIIIRVSKGRVYTMPELIDKSVDDVQKELATLPHELTYQYTADKEEGIIFKTSVASGRRVFEDFPVEIKVSKGIYKYLEDQSGKTPEDAKQYLENLGLHYSVEEVFSSDVEEGYVVNVFPDHYGEVGETVALRISKGKGVKVPNVVGLTLTKAKKKLEQAGFIVKVEYKFADMSADCGYEAEETVAEQSLSDIAEEAAKIKLTCLKPAIKVSAVNFSLNYVGGVDTYFTLKNNSDKQIAYVDIEVKYYDSMGYPAFCSIQNTPTATLQYTGPLNAGRSSGKTCWEAVIYNSATAAMKPVSAKVTFTDHTTQKIEYNSRYWYLDNYYGGDLND